MATLAGDQVLQRIATAMLELTNRSGEFVTEWAVRNLPCFSQP